MVTNFHQVWHIALAINAEQCGIKKLFTSHRVFMHTSCKIMRAKIVTKIV